MNLRELLHQVFCTKEQRTRDEAVQKAVKRAEEVSDRVKRQVLNDQTWDNLRRHT